MVDLAAHNLFGRHVSWRPHHHACFRVPGRRLGSGGRVGRVGLLREAEVEYLDATLACDHYIGGLQVAMHDAFFMRGGERASKRSGNLDDSLDGKAAFRNEPIERPALDQLHREKVNAVGFLHRVERDDVRVIEGGDGAGFALEAREAL